MKGTILGVDFAANEAVITGDDGTRCKFASSEWKMADAPTRGQRVDFEVADGRAIGVYLDIPATPSASAGTRPPAGGGFASTAPTGVGSECPSGRRGPES